MQKQKFILPSIILLLALSALSLCAVVALKNQDKEYQGLFFRHMKVVAPDFPSMAAFAGEAAVAGRAVASLASRCGARLSADILANGLGTQLSRCLALGGARAVHALR